MFLTTNGRNPQWLSELEQPINSQRMNFDALLMKEPIKEVVYLEVKEIIKTITTTCYIQNTFLHRDVKGKIEKFPQSNTLLLTAKKKQWKDGKNASSTIYQRHRQTSICCGQYTNGRFTKTSFHKARQFNISSVIPAVLYHLRRPLLVVLEHCVQNLRTSLYLSIKPVESELREMQNNWIPQTMKPRWQTV